MKGAKQGHQGRGGWPNWGGRGGHGGQGRWGGQCNGEWRQNKALVLSTPEDVLTGNAGQIVFANIKVKNGMNWPWKEGASLQSENDPKTAEQIEELVLPIDFPVPAGHTFDLAIPIKIRDNAVAGDEVYYTRLVFHGRQGRQFGTPIFVKIKVSPKFDEAEFYDRAVRLF